ncbi:MFS transporter [Paracoccus sp. CPCC 101403]|uniref:MFS transporter n=1 Tax=Paracoccus broussonetiae TaxID=3075834 RepID=A0ABU3EKG0_9RHOB|nr:MFS transporter [Paracoccus sp. CPCC 101403]MDT1064566.1 MFS transporter [Paracoccus sp. CPCC 101403]
MTGYSTARITLGACFLAGGFGIGTWGANLPAPGRRAALDESGIGIVLLCFAAGAILAMNRTPQMIARIGAARLATLAVGLFGMGIALVATAAQFGVAMVIAGLCGAAFGALDVSMNSHAADLEARAKRPIMSTLHAMFSGGTLAGAMAYAALARGGMGSSSILLGAGCIILAIAAATFLRTSPAPDHNATIDHRSAAAKPGLSALRLGLLAFVIFLAEGAIMDWSAVYLVRVLGTTESTGAAGYGVFAAAMLTGRLAGDRVNQVLGPLRLFALGTALVTVSLAGLLLSDSVLAVFVALILCGLGMSNIIPLIFSTAGRLGAADGGRSLSRVLTMGYAGILLGPAMIGFVAEASSLQFSLMLVLTSVAAMMFFGKAALG